MWRTNLTVVVVIIALILFAIGIVKYNGLVTHEEAVEKAWAPLVAKLKQRYASVPKLVADVTAYVGRKPPLAKELEDDLAKVTEVKTISEAVDFANQVETDLMQLGQFLAERYPMIINRHSMQVIRDIMQHTDETIGPEVKNFNDAANEYNTYSRRFPNNIVAVLIRFPNTYMYFQPKK
jgi:LemA protein